MLLWVFSSSSLRNVRIGYNCGIWAVSRTEGSVTKGRITKAVQMPPNSRGLLYCSRASSFMVPFRTLSWVEKRREDEVWAPETWILPFKIKPLGSPDAMVMKTHAKRDWPFLADVANITQRINGIAGTSAFVPTEIGEEDWTAILASCGEESDEGFEEPATVSEDKDGWWREFL